VLLRRRKRGGELRGAAGFVGSKKNKSPFVVLGPSGGTVLPGVSTAVTLRFSGKPNAVSVAVFAATPPQ
jgi:hypothetical protein